MISSSIPEFQVPEAQITQLQLGFVATIDGHVVEGLKALQSRDEDTTRVRIELAAMMLARVLETADGAAEGLKLDYESTHELVSRLVRQRAQEIYSVGPGDGS